MGVWRVRFGEAVEDALRQSIFGDGGMYMIFAV